jgi:prevent-host-death family protein
MDTTQTISATEFKAKCLDILNRLSAHELTRVMITKRGRVVAVLTPPADDAAAVRALPGCMRGSVIIPPGVDLTAPTDEVWDAESGVLRR